MRPDYISCGSCSSEFLLSDLNIFIEHKRSDCSKSSLEPQGDDLQCSQCVRRFHTPWPLLFHIQNDHGIRVVRNMSEVEGYSLTSSCGLATPQYPCEHDESPSDESPAVDSLNQNGFGNPYSANSDQLALQPSNSSMALSSTQSQVSKRLCSQKSCSNNGSRLRFQSISYDSNPMTIALNLEESLRLIHGIACSNLDMNVSKTSSYALSLCCTQKGLSCLCTVDACSCTNPCSRLTASASVQTDDLSDLQALELLPSPTFPPLSGKPQFELSPPDLTDFSFLGSLVQNPNSESSSSLNASYLPSSPNEVPVYTQPEVVPQTPSSSAVKPLEEKLLPNYTSQKLTAFSCSFCNRYYRQKVHLRKHVMAQHTKEKPFFCPHCNYTTVEKSHLTVHIRTHTGERPFSCRVCHYSSTQNCTLKSHYLRKHPESKINCTVCGGAYITELEFQNHMKNCSLAYGAVS